GDAIETGHGQVFFQRVMDHAAYHVVVARQLAEILQGRFIQCGEVTEHIKRAAGFGDAADLAKRHAQSVRAGRGILVARAAAGGILGQSGIVGLQLVEQVQGGTTTALGANQCVIGIRPDQPADAIAVVDGHPAEYRRRLRRDDRFECDLAAEEHAAALVHGDNDGTLTLFAEHLGKGLAGARGHAPVDGPDVIALLVGTEFLEVDTAAAHARHVQAGDAGDGAVVGDIRHDFRRVALDQQLLQRYHGTSALVQRLVWLDWRWHGHRDQVSSGHVVCCYLHRGRAPGPALRPDQAAGTRSRIVVRTLSGVTPLASASKLSSTRWRSTSKNTAWTSSGLTKSLPSIQAWARAQRSSEMVPRGLAPNSSQEA